jgi:cytochrome c oxidase subunit 2
MITIGVVAAIVGTIGALQIDWFPGASAKSAGKIDTVYDVLLIASVPIFVLVMTVAIYSVVKFRARPGDMRDGAPIHGNTRLEIFWVTVPFLMVTGLAIYGWVVLNDLEAKQPNSLKVNVIGQQFTWSFQYPDQGKAITHELVLPKDRPVDFSIHTKDVIHSFWVPEFRLKSDAVPGMTTKIRLTPDKLGKWQVVCAELCGLGHATMRNPVRVVRPAAFTAWVKKANGGGGGPGAAKKPDGKQIFTSTGCGSCHTLGDAGTNGNVGPKLDTLTADAAKYGKQLKETPEEYVKQSIQKPSAFTVPGFPKGVMPSNYGNQLSPEQLDALVSYLLRVSKGGNGK